MPWALPGHSRDSVQALHSWEQWLWESCNSLSTGSVVLLKAACCSISRALALFLHGQTDPTFNVLFVSLSRKLPVHWVSAQV